MNIVVGIGTNSSRVRGARDVSSVEFRCKIHEDMVLAMRLKIKSSYKSQTQIDITISDHRLTWSIYNIPVITTLTIPDAVVV